MKLDEAVLEELGRGSGTSGDIAERLSKHVYEALQRLVKAQRVVKEGDPGKGKEKLYSLPPLKRRSL